MSLRSNTFKTINMKNNTNEIEEMFKELFKIREEWVVSSNNPSLSEFIQSSVILVRKFDNELVAWFPNSYENIDEIKNAFTLPTSEHDVEKKRFELCESQYDFQMWGLKIKRDLNELNKKDITLDEFLERNPEIKKGNNNDSKTS